MRHIVAALLLLALAGCGSAISWNERPRQAERVSQPGADEHIVQRGETLYSIAWRYGQDPADVARWNRLGDGSLIYPGQVIRLEPRGGRQTRPAPTVASAPAQAATQIVFCLALGAALAHALVWPSSLSYPVDRMTLGVGILGAAALPIVYFLCDDERQIP